MAIPSKIAIHNTGHFLSHSIVRGPPEGMFALPDPLFYLFVGIKPEKPYSASCVGREVYPLGMITYWQRHKPRSYQRQRHKPRICQSMVNTPQVDGLVRRTHASPIQGACSATERRPPMPCLTYWFWTGGEINDLVDRDHKLPPILTAGRGPGRCSNLVKKMPHSFVRGKIRENVKLSPFEKFR